MPLFNYLKKQLTFYRELSLFTLTVILFSFIIISSLIAWIHIFLKSQEEPTAVYMSERTSLNIDTFEKALQHISPEQHTAFIQSYAQGSPFLFLQKGNPSDSYTLAPNSIFWNKFKTYVTSRHYNKEPLIFASSVNHIKGVWVGFKWKDQHYWLLNKSNDRHTPQMIRNHVSSGIVILIFSIIGTWITIGSINRYLRPIIKVTNQISQGQQPTRLPEDHGPKEIKEINTIINHMVQELEQNENDRKVMLAGISHDLRTPISRINLEIEMMDIDDKIRDSINEDLDQMTHIIDQLMLFSTSKQHEHKMIVLELSSVLNSLCRHQQQICESMNYNLTYQITPNLKSYIPKTHITRVILNLIENAKKYGHLPGEMSYINIHAYQQDHKIFIDVSDQGPGIDEQEKKRIMRPFSRGNQARTGVEGAGLGLAIVERLLTPYKGKINLISKQNQGLTCRIELPSVIE